MPRRCRRAAAHTRSSRCTTSTRRASRSPRARTCVGINNRDLRTLRTDLATFARVRQAVPDDVLCIAESGVRTATTSTRLVSEGADAVLVGEALMRADSPAAGMRRDGRGGARRRQRVVIVKVCGVRTPEVAEAAIDAGADWIGLMLVPASPRWVDDAAARAVRAGGRGRADLVGVFVEPSAGECDDAASRYRLAAVQVHGAFDPSLATDCSVPVIPVFNVDEPGRRRCTIDWSPDVLVMLDGMPGRGGAPRRHRASRAAGVGSRRRAPPRDPARRRARAGRRRSGDRAVRPAGVDASSRLETAARREGSRPGPRASCSPRAAAAQLVGSAR